MGLIVTLQNALIVLVVLVLIGAFPASSVIAEENTDSASATESTESEEDNATRGPTEPQGPDANTYTYNPDTGKWENENYIWDPVTNQSQPKNPQDYSYNPDSGRWDTTDWLYNPTSGKYEPNTPTASTEKLPEEDQNSAGSGQFDLFYDASISNRIEMETASGDASVNNNTLAGNALSGNASSMLNLINMIQTSASSLQGSNLAVFNRDVYGNLQGDLMIDPQALFATDANSSSPNNLTINTEASGTIDNNITLASHTGDASVSTNTTAGNAASGNAAAVVNIVNMINSIISSGQSFLGSVNIYGSLDGDILLPPELLDILLASNSGSSSLPSTTDTVADVTSNQSINNQVNLAAISGDAVVTNNTSAGGATTGNAQTNLTILNLVGSQVVGKDVLLVFINVMGNWVGVLYSAPPGSTAAAIGGGITQNDSLADSLNVNSTTNQSINNDIDLAAVSGDATVAENTTAGNATSGDAMAAANLLNILNSTFSLADWFGVLFINVFGSWNGSFGIDTLAGNQSQIDPGINSNQGNNGNRPVNDVRVFRFVPADGGPSGINTRYELSGGATASQRDSTPDIGSILGDLPKLRSATNATNLSSGSFNVLFPLIGGIIGVSLLGAEKIIKRREEIASLRELSNIVFRGKL